MGMYNGVQIDLHLSPTLPHAMLKVLLMMSMFTEEGDADKILDFMHKSRIDPRHPFFSGPNWANLLRDGEMIKPFAPHQWELPKLYCAPGGEWIVSCRSYTKCTSVQVLQFIDWLSSYLHRPLTGQVLARVWYEETASDEHRMIRVDRHRRIRQETHYERDVHELYSGLGG